MKDTVHLLSGGLDSVAMLHENRDRIALCLLLDYKQRHKQELQFAIVHAKRVGIPFLTLELPQLGGLNEQSWIVPNRNAIFISVAANVASQTGNSVVTIGCNRDDADYFPDCRPAFIEASNAMLAAAGYSIRVETPYLKKTKAEIMQIAKRFGILPDEIWTCYQPTETGKCGKCPACTKLEKVCGQ